MKYKETCLLMCLQKSVSASLALGWPSASLGFSCSLTRGSSPLATSSLSVASPVPLDWKEPSDSFSSGTKLKEVLHFSVGFWWCCWDGHSLACVLNSMALSFSSVASFLLLSTSSGGFQFW